MKKLFIAILAVAGLAACSQDMTLETPKGAAIAFDNAFVNNSTRVATDITVGNLKDFGVYGSVVNNQGQQGLIFKKQKVEKSGNDFLVFAFNFSDLKSETYAGRSVVCAKEPAGVHIVASGKNQTVVETKVVPKPAALSWAGYLDEVHMTLDIGVPTAENAG